MYNSYYNNLLNGNVPSSVLECMIGFNNMYTAWNSNKYPFVNINNDVKIKEFIYKNISPENKVIFNKSLNLNRGMILNGLKNGIEKVVSSSNKTDLYKNIVTSLKSKNKNDDINDIISLLFTTNNNEKDELLFRINSNFNQSNPLKYNAGRFLKYFNNNNLNVNIFANDVLSSLEYVLYNLSLYTTNNKLCYVYLISIQIANDLSNIIEPFVLNIGSKQKVDNSKRLENIKDITNKINQKKVISGVNALITNAVTEAVSNNKAELTKALITSNKLNISNVRSKNLVLKDINQNNNVNENIDMTSVQTTLNKINNEISDKLFEQIKSKTDSNMSSIDKSLYDESEATQFGDAIKDVLSANLGGSTNIDNSQQVTDKLKKVFDLDQSFQYNKDNKNNVDLKNLITQDQLSGCASDSNFQNEINLSGGNYDNIVLENVNQNNVINSFMKCTFTQEAINEVSTSIARDMMTTLDEMAANVNSSLTDDQKKKVVGDIYAVGTAAQQTLEGVGSAAEGVGKGVGSAAEGIGSGFSSIIQAYGMIILGGIFGFIFFIGLIVFLYKKMKGSGSTNVVDTNTSIE